MSDVSIWLLPQEDQEKILKQKIDDLAVKFGAFPFIPHVTVFHLANVADMNIVDESVTEVIKNFSSINLLFEGVRFSEVFTKTFYIKYTDSKEYIDLHDRLQEKFPDDPYSVSAHLSLLYKNNWDYPNKESLVGREDVPNVLKLNRVAIIVKDGGSIKEEKDVLYWKVFKEYRLIE